MGRIHVTRLNGLEIWGALIIGRLTPTNMVRIDGNHVFLREDGEKVYCTPEMFNRINERLAANGF